MSNIDLSTTTLDPLTTGFTIKGQAPTGQFGYTGSCAGDINKDGIDDIVIGSLGSYSEAPGNAFVIYGRKTGFSDIDLSNSTSFPATSGFMITKPPSASEGFSQFLASIDIGNDGFSDLLIADPWADELKGSVYLMIFNECPNNCITCSSTSECTECFDGYGLDDNSQCKACPLNCDICSKSSSCDVCSTGKYSFHGECFDACPGATFPIDNEICQSCSVGCIQCENDSVCQTCADGFILSDLKSCQKIASAGALEKTFEGMSLIEASLSCGSSLPMNFGMATRILRNVKYLNITVSPQLNEAFYSWKVDSEFIAAPKSLSLITESNNLPGVFSRYGLNPVFLINFWKPFVLSLIGLAIFLVFKSVEMVLAKNNDRKNTLYSISRYVNIAASNFALTQFYSNLDDAVLYFIIEVRSTGLDILAMTFLVFGGIFIGLHSKLLNHYQAIKNQRVAGPLSPLEIFVSKCENIRLITRDFKDDTRLMQSFLLVNLIRSMISSLVISIFFDYPVLQMIVLLILSVFMIVYLLAKKPFKALFDTYGQLFCELVLLMANFCLFTLSLSESPSSIQCIVALHYILLLGCTVLLVINIGKSFYIAYEDRKSPFVSDNEKNHFEFVHLAEDNLSPEQKNSGIESINEEHSGIDQNGC